MYMTDAKLFLNFVNYVFYVNYVHWAQDNFTVSEINSCIARKYFPKSWLLPQPLTVRMKATHWHERNALSVACKAQWNIDIMKEVLHYRNLWLYRVTYDKYLRLQKKDRVCYILYLWYDNEHKKWIYVTSILYSWVISIHFS